MVVPVHFQNFDHPTAEGGGIRDHRSVETKSRKIASGLSGVRARNARQKDRDRHPLGDSSLRRYE